MRAERGTACVGIPRVNVLIIMHIMRSSPTALCWTRSERERGDYHDFTQYSLPFQAYTFSLENVESVQVVIPESIS